LPYITATHRNRLDPHIARLAEEISRLAREDTHEAAFAGLLNYSCTKLALGTIPARRYWAIATVIGVLRNVADEFYRRYGVPYEEEKMAAEGDVYP
jgi:Domain of unknown function (DUF6899)